MQTRIVFHSQITWTTKEAFDLFLQPPPFILQPSSESDNVKKLGKIYSVAQKKRSLSTKPAHAVNEKQKIKNNARRESQTLSECLEWAFKLITRFNIKL